jgi:putative cell wall-binding protein
VVLAALSLAAAAPVHASDSVEVRRLEGSTRYETAAATAIADWADTRAPAQLVIASGEDFPDALSGTAAAGYYRGPLLLTRRDALPAATIDALQHFQAADVAVVGGTAAISATVEQQLNDLGHPTYRTAGADRYATAVATAESLTDSGSHGPSFQAVLTTGEAFPDAVAAGQLLYGNHASRSLLLTHPRQLPEVTRQHLSKYIEDVIILGGTDAVSNAIEAEIRSICCTRGTFTQPCIQVQRIAGPNRYATAVAASDHVAAQTSGFTGRWWDGSRVTLSNGQSFPDALIAGRHANWLDSVSVFAESAERLGSETRDFLERHRASISRLDLIGDRGVLSDATASEAKIAATN